MIRSVCSVCGYVYRTQDDGKPGVMDSHGYCQKHFDEAMLEMQATLVELEPDRRAA